MAEYGHFKQIKHTEQEYYTLTVCLEKASKARLIISTEANWSQQFAHLEWKSWNEFGGVA